MLFAQQPKETNPMPLFGISKTETQRLIDAAVKDEARIRANADLILSTSLANLDARISALTSRVTTLETGTPPPPPPDPPTAALQIVVNETVDDEHTHIGLTGKFTPPDATVTVECGDPVATTHDAGWNWILRRDVVDITVWFVLVVKANNETTSAQASAVIPAKPAPPPPPPPPPQPFEVVVAAADMKIEQAVGMKLSGDHFSDWGHPGEAVSLAVHADEPTTIIMDFDYVVARVSEPDGADRKVPSGEAGTVLMQCPPTCDTWDMPVRGVSAPVSFSIAAGDTTILISMPDGAPDWSNWLDLYNVRLRSDKRLTR